MKKMSENVVRVLLNRIVIAFLGAISGWLFAAFPMEMAALCVGA